VRQALPELESQGFFERLDQVYSSGEAFVADRQVIRIHRDIDAGAEERFVTFVYQPITGADGLVSGIFVEGSDVTDAVRAEEERERLARQLLEERARLESLIENLPVGVGLLEEEGNTLVMNSAFRRYRPDGVIPLRLPDGAEQWIGYDGQGE
jgi:PAS domain-containing protein